MNGMSTYEDDVRLFLQEKFQSGELVEISQSDFVFDLLGRRYPVLGSKIDWKRLPDSIVKSLGCDGSIALEFSGFFNDVCRKENLDGHVFYVGDSATDFAIKGSVSSISESLKVLLEIPQHHYFVGENGDWCMCVTMEGDMAFARALKL